MKKKPKFGWVMPAFIVFIMVMSVFMYALQGDDSYGATKYKDFKFRRQQTGWVTNIDGQDILFNYLPEQVEHIEVPLQVFQSLDTKQVYMTYDPDSELKQAFARFEFGFQNLALHLDTYTVWGFTKENPYNKTIIDCINATQFVPVIKFEKSDNLSVEWDNNCIIIKAKDEVGLISINDRLFYGMFGVI